jgi:hypothetical protein
MPSLDIVPECPACRSRRIARISYGLVEHTEELRQDLQAGRVILGGCFITDKSPIWHCNECGLEGGRLDLSEWTRAAPRSLTRPLLVLLVVLVGCVLVLAPILLGAAYLTMDRPLVGYGIWLGIWFCLCFIPIVIGRWAARRSYGSDSTRNP